MYSHIKTKWLQASRFCHCVSILWTSYWRNCTELRISHITCNMCANNGPRFRSQLDVNQRRDFLLSTAVRMFNQVQTVCFVSILLCVLASGIYLFLCFGEYVFWIIFIVIVFLMSAVLFGMLFLKGLQWGMVV